MENNINENDLPLEYPDFNKLYTFKSEIRKAPKDTLLGVGKITFWIYLITLAVSIGLCIIPFYLNITDELQSVLVSVGTSGVGAVLLGYFIDVAMTCADRSRKVRSYNDCIISLYNNLWIIFGNGTYSYLNNIHSNAVKQNSASRCADQFIFQFKSVIPQIESFSLAHGEWFDEYTQDACEELKKQLIKYVASLQNPLSTEHLIQLLDGTRINLRKFCNRLKMKRLFIRE